MSEATSRLTFSPAEDADLGDIADLVNASYRGAQGWTTEAGYIDGARTDAETLLRHLAAAPDATLQTMRDSAAGPILGVVWLEPANAGAWYIGMLTVDPGLQDRKLGRALLEAAESFIVDRGGVCALMTVVNIRDTLIAWYERRGYRSTGETQPFPYDDSRFGAPLRDDLHFVVLSKTLASQNACA